MKVYNVVASSDAFTHGPTGPGPRGPLKILKLGGPEQKFEKLMNFANLDKDSFIGIVPRCTYSCIGVFNFSSFAVSNYFVDINLFGDWMPALIHKLHANWVPSTMHVTNKFLGIF